MFSGQCRVGHHFVGLDPLHRVADALDLHGLAAADGVYVADLSDQQLDPHLAGGRLPLKAVGLEL